MSAPQRSALENRVRQQALEWLNRLRASSNEQDHADFERWYCADPLHADIYDDVLATWEKTGLVGKIPSAAAPNQQPRGSQFRYALAAAAAVTLVVLAALALDIPGAGKRPARDDIAAPSGEIRIVDLIDGSRITLDSGSFLRIAYSQEERRIALERGRARFDVAHEPERPFIVTAGGQAVVARGTVFDVTRIEDRVTVSLLEGKVEIRGEPTASLAPPSTSIFLSPGQRVTIDPDVPRSQPSSFASAKAQWPSGMLSFEDTPLRDVVATANRYNETHIVVADPALDELQFTGAVRATRPDELARMIAAMFRLSLSRDAAGNIIVARRPTQIDKVSG